MSSKRILIAAALLLGGCQTGNLGNEDPGLGEAVRYNAAIQTINPAPIYPEDGAQPGDNGDKGAQAVKRYRSDEVKKVETMDTTTQGSGGTPR